MQKKDFLRVFYGRTPDVEDSEIISIQVVIKLNLKKYTNLILTDIFGTKFATLKYSLNLNSFRLTFTFHGIDYWNW